MGELPEIKERLGEWLIGSALLEEALEEVLHRLKEREELRGTESKESREKEKEREYTPRYCPFCGKKLDAAERLWSVCNRCNMAIYVVGERL